MYDVAIIGTGVAGISAALTLRARNKSIVLIGKNELSKKMFLAEQIRNYPGLGIISGMDMAAKFTDHLKQMNIGITEKHVTEIVKAGSHFQILCGQEQLQACSVILAMGVANAHTYPGEDELLGKGVSYCATCDGFLYQGKPIAVMCTSKEFEEEIDYLAHTASKVYLIANYKDVKAFPENVQVISGKNLVIRGVKHVEGISLDETEYAVDAVFLMRESIAPGNLLKGIALSDNHINVSRDCSTNISGCYAAGDCTGRPYQYAKAAGEGNVAAHSALSYLAENGLTGDSKTRPYRERPYTFQDAIDVTDMSSFPSEETIRKLVKFNLTKGEVQYVPKETAENGDVITFTAKGGAGRFNRENLRLTLGQNLYDYDVEKALIGARKGDVVVVQKDRTTVSVTVLEICKPLSIEPTDEMVKALGDASVQTLDEYYRKIKAETEQNAIYEIAYKVFSELAEQEPDPETSDEIVKRLGELELEFFDKMFNKEFGRGIYDMDSEELSKKLGVKTPEEFLIMRAEWYRMKHRQLLAFSKALGIPLDGDYDFMNHYEALSKLQEEGILRIQKALTGEAEEQND